MGSYGSGARPRTLAKAVAMRMQETGAVTLVAGPRKSHQYKPHHSSDLRKQDLPYPIWTRE